MPSSGKRSGCGKRRYRTEIDAKIALASCQRVTRGPERRYAIERRHYHCPRCKGWHLTSQA